MRKKQKWYIRWNVQIMLILIAVCFAMGWYGYVNYYNVTAPVRFSKRAETTALSEPAQTAELIQSVEPAQSAEPILTTEPSETLSAHENQNERIPASAFFWRPLFSTLKLFAGVFDASYSPAIEKALTSGELPIGALFCLALARTLALIPAGVAVVTMLKKLWPKLWARLGYLRWSRRIKKTLLIGNNKENIRLYRSSGDDKSVLLLAEVGGDTIALREHGVHYYMPQNYEFDTLDDEVLENILTEQIKKTLAQEDGDIAVIINTGDEERNLHLCKAAAACIHQAVEADQTALEERMKTVQDRRARKTDPDILKHKWAIVQKLERIRVAVIGSKEFEEIYQTFENVSYGTLKYTNRYHLSAFDFVTKYPMTQFMTGEKSAYLTGDGCVTNDAEFNVILVGFGDTTREILQDSLVVNQFITRGENAVPQFKPVSYHIFDKRREASHDKNLNHNVFRYVDDFAPLFEKEKGKKDGTPDPRKKQVLKKEDYLELPPTPLTHRFYDIDINSDVFYDRIREICTEKPNSINYLVIAIGRDFENIDLAQRLSDKKIEWELKDLHIFVKVRDSMNEKTAKLLAVSDSDIIMIGNEAFTLDQILMDEIEKLAHQRKQVTRNELQADENSKKTEDSLVNALYDWHMMHHIMRRSNIYNILALRMKLQLLGLDYTTAAQSDEDGEKGLTQEEYFDIYARGCKPVKTRDPERFRGAMYDYDDFTFPWDYRNGLPRRNLCVQEHYRWNAYMIKSGFIPPTLAEVKKGFVKDYGRKRKHANLCTFEALFEYREIRAEFCKTEEKEEDVIGYDYKLMDEAWFFLNACGYKIVRRKK